MRKYYGIIVLDATEADIYFNKPLIFAAYQDKYIYWNKEHSDLEKIDLYLHDFYIYKNNLQIF
ncbi:hypothetical protein LJC73_01540 [Bacteroidales bacterium OttesenSCG-928-L14]|nr:hypothetical protein [Bacteroidales bacterium OttesenSCG-928-L14]